MPTRYTLHRCPLRHSRCRRRAYGPPEPSSRSHNRSRGFARGVVGGTHNVPRHARGKSPRQVTRVLGGASGREELRRSRVDRGEADRPTRSTFVASSNDARPDAPRETWARGSTGGISETAAAGDTYPTLCLGSTCSAPSSFQTRDRLVPPASRAPPGNPAPRRARSPGGPRRASASAAARSRS